MHSVKMRHILAQLGLAAAVVAYPRFLGSVPASKESVIMQQTGIYDKTILSGTTLRCNDGDGFVVWGQDFTLQSSTFGNNNDDGSSVNEISCKSPRCHSAEEDFFGPNMQGTLILTYTGSVTAMCAQNNKALEWRIAAVNAQGTVYDPIPDKRSNAATAHDVLIVGGGVGGWAAAAALAGSNLSVALMTTSATPTTALSTGVAWFPGTNDTIEQLATASGDGWDQELMEAYLSKSGEVYEYWRDKLQLTPFVAASGDTPPNYYAKAEPASRRSYVASACVSDEEAVHDGNTKSCGLELLLKLQTIAQNVSIISATAVSASMAGNALNLVDATGKTHTAQTVIVATGGIGYHKDQTTVSTDVILAQKENTGFVKDLARDLGLTAINDIRAWNLEFQKLKVDDDWTEVWFPFTYCCVPDRTVPNYNLCDDYSTRALALGKYNEVFAARLSRSDENNCNDEGKSPSSQYWYTFFEGLYGVCMADADHDVCADTDLRRGVIDVKGGFKLNSKFQSIDNSRVFASGTAAAHFTGDKYFAPGSTIGLALHTGYVAAMAARDLPYVQTQPSGAKVKRTAVPYTFYTATWLALVGIAAHATGYNNVHYVFMAAATATATAGAAVAATQNWRVAHNSPHAVLGWALLAFMWANALGGTAIWSSRRYGWPFQNVSSIGRWHRVAGAIIVAMMAAATLSGARYAIDYYESYTKTAVWTSSGFFAAAAAVAVTAIVYRMRTNTRPTPAPSVTTDNDNLTTVSLL